MAAGVRTREPGRTMELLDSLRSAVSAVAPPASSAWDDLEAALSRTLAEHAGMANELLRVYEQLGIVFEVTRQLSTVNTEGEVIELFVGSLRTTYSAAKVYVVKAGPAGELLPPPELNTPAWVGDALQECRQQRRVVVADCPHAQRRGDRALCNGCGRWGTCDERFLRAMCGPVYAGDSFVFAALVVEEEFHDTEESLRAFDASHMSLLDSLNLFCGDLIRNLRLVGELRQLSVDVVRALISAIEQKDEYTSGHSTRVGQYAVLLGRDLGLNEPELQMLEWSALLHDIGKIGIRDGVLKKPGRLTAEEFRHIQEHPARSREVVRQIPQLAAALDGVAYHHEHWDGGGYPEGLAGEDIPVQARIIQVADIFDALTSTRSYRDSFTWDKALGILREESGTTTDPNMVARFDRLIRNMVEDEPQRLEAIMSINRERHQVAAVAPAGVDGDCI